MNSASIPDNVMEHALQWHLRVNAPDASAETWTAFAEWMAADPLHNEAYDHISLLEADLDEWSTLQREGEKSASAGAASAQANLSHDNDDEPRRRWFAYGGLGLAASILLTVILWPQLSGPQFQTITTQPGQTEIVEMGEGSRIHINGDSEVIIEPGNDRFAQLERGEAIFYVEHDARNPFTVHSGKYKLIDRGTIFNVRRTEQEFSVGVSEGVVIFRDDQKMIQIDSGKMLSISATGGGVLKPIDLAQVDGWTRRQLSYDMAPIGTVIADINRNTGLAISVDPSIAAQTFSGTIQLQDDSENMIDQLEQLLDLDAQDTKPGWLLTR
jgi:transmembrane sensor